jgi:hypothetical protein
VEPEAVLGHLNLLEFARENARWARNHTVVDEGGVLMFAGDTDWPAFNNGVLRTDDRADPAELLGRAQEFFHDRGRGFSLWARQLDVDADLGPAAETAGAARIFDYPQMIRRERFDERLPPAGVEIRRVIDAADITDFAEINAQAYSVYGSPAQATASNFGRPDRVLAPHIAAFIASLDGRPVGAAMAMLSHGIAGIFWSGPLMPRGAGESRRRACAWSRTGASTPAPPTCSSRRRRWVSRSIAAWGTRISTATTSGSTPAPRVRPPGSASSASRSAALSASGP